MKSAHTHQERLLTNVDEVLCTQIIGGFFQYRPLLDKVRNTYERLESGPFNTELWEEVKTEGSIWIEERFIADIDSQMNDSGLKNSRLRTTVLDSGIRDSLNEFTLAVQALRDFTIQNSSGKPVLTIEYISFDGENGFHVSEADRENIMEQYCRTYMETEQEHALYSFMGKAQALRAEFAEINRRFDLNYKPNFSFTVLDQFFKENYETINGLSIKSETVAKKYR